MVAVASLLIILALSVLVVRIASVALVMTGLSQEVADFQALSAFSGAGYTTVESESIVGHPARRNIAKLLIRLGSVGAVTAISTLILSFVGAGRAAPERLLVIAIGVLLLILIARSESFDRFIRPLIRAVLERYTTLEIRDYADLLHLHEDYRIVEIDVEENSWLSSMDLQSLDLASEGILVLGIVRDTGKYIGAPPADLTLAPGDRLLVYGRQHRLKEISGRASGDEAAHEAATSEHDRDLEAQRRF
ncbi:MAG: TrkA C-terminal domain-containing protein [Thermoanaerobaculia bacterium]|nr:TrkA C-terminal domain-containing protein [Thermoanaerobaculia bacterium]